MKKYLVESKTRHISERHITGKPSALFHSKQGEGVVFMEMGQTETVKQDFCFYGFDCKKGDKITLKTQGGANVPHVFEITRQ